MNGLFLTLKGSMRSWGCTSIGDDRWSEQFPTASAILGLTGACIGVDYNDSEQTTTWYSSFFVCTISALSYENKYHSKPTYYPAVLTDYQTTKNSLNMNNTRRKGAIISNRSYIANGLDVAAIIPVHTKAEEWLKQLSFAIQQPHFIPYLGRRANPLSAPLAEPGEKIAHADNIEELLELLFLRFSHQRIGNNKPAECLLRIPNALKKENDTFKENWIFSGNVTLSDQRAGLLRCYKNRSVQTYRRTIEAQ